MADNMAAVSTASEPAEYFLDLDDLDLAGVDVDTWDKTAGGTTSWPCVVRTIVVVTRNVCGSADCGPPSGGGGYRGKGRGCSRPQATPCGPAASTSRRRMWLT